MLTFKNYLNNHLLTEGGKALKGVSRINQLNVEDTLSSIDEIIISKLKESQLISDYRVTGSTGKKDPSQNGKDPEGSSGDIDLAIDLPEEKYEEFVEVMNSLGLEIRSMEGIGVLSVKFPIESTDGEQDGEYVQLDLMPVGPDGLDWAEWAYYSPSYDESEFKGLFRNELMFAVARYADEEVTETDEDGSPLTWNRYFYTFNEGLLHGTQTLKGEDGKILKNKKTVDKVLNTLDPNEASKILFGEDVASNDVLTFEQVYDIIVSPSFKHTDSVDRILDMAADGISNKNQEVPAILRR